MAQDEGRVEGAGTPGAADPELRMTLVTGSTPKLSGETRRVLQERLAGAAAVFLGVSTVFFLWRFIVPQPVGEGCPWLFAAHAISLATNAILLLLLRRRSGLGATSLHAIELGLFGPLALHMTMLGYHKLVSAGTTNEQASIALPWIFLMIVHGVFIPAGLRRSVLVLAGLAVTPVAQVLILRTTHAELVRLYPIAGVVEMALFLGCVATALVIGNRLIEQLRTENFQARRFGQYKLCRELGAGGMGRVYLAEHQLLKRPCAIKLISPEMAGDPEALQRFELEVKTTATLSHWNSIQIFDYGRTDDGALYYVMELLDGLTIEEVVERSGPMTPARVIALMRQVCQALQEAHSVGFVHRDIKPTNIIVARCGGRLDVAKLVDFGLVKPIAGGDRERLNLTDEHAVVGTPLFMSPEQCLAKDLDGRSDLYSLGATAWFALTGRPLFEGDSAMAVLVAHIKETPRRPSEVGVEIREDLEAVVMRCLAKEPEQRFASATELERALGECADGERWDQQQAERWWADHGPRDVPGCEPCGEAEAGAGRAATTPSSAETVVLPSA